MVNLGWLDCKTLAPSGAVFVSTPNGKNASLLDNN